MWLRGLNGFQGQGRVGEGTSGSHLRGHPDRLHDFRGGVALADGQIGVAVDAVRALGHVRDGYRDELLGFLGQRAVGEDGLAEALESVMDAGRQLLARRACSGVVGWYRDSLIGFSFVEVRLRSGASVLAYAEASRPIRTRQTSGPSSR